MIVSPSGDPLQDDVGDGPAELAFCEALRMSDLRFLHDPERAGLDCRCERDLETGPNRARIKVFSPRRGTTLAFLYKDSQVPFSTDRFAYGALIVKNRPPTGEECAGLIEYLASGLHPERRPRWVKRAFPFDIPR
ncbi:MAG: hypothetical protein CMJ83_07520 [Planctomycetes bacterium]|nr:hypothetical protein [Planctomycetota bacterium]